MMGGVQTYPLNMWACLLRAGMVPVVAFGSLILFTIASSWILVRKPLGGDVSVARLGRAQFFVSMLAVHFHIIYASLGMSAGIWGGMYLWLINMAYAGTTCLFHLSVIMAALMGTAIRYRSRLEPAWLDKVGAMAALLSVGLNAAIGTIVIHFCGQ